MTDRTDYMLDEMNEQPALFRWILERGVADLDALRTRPAPETVVFTGSGDSFCAAECGAWALRDSAAAGGWSGTALAVRPLDLARYRHDLLRPGVWVVAISASGRTPRVREAAAAARAGGAWVLAVSDDPASPVASEADHVWPLAASPAGALAVTDYDGEEARAYVGYHHDVPQTKTFTASVLVLHRLAEVLADGGGGAHRRALAGLSVVAEDALARTAEPAAAAAQEAIGSKAVIFVGSGRLLPHARYGAFKMYELARLGLWQETEEYCHTQYFATDSDTTVIFLAADSLARERALEVAPVLRERLGARPLLISAGVGGGETADTPETRIPEIRAGAGGAAVLHPFLINLAVQRFAHAYARAAGLSTSTFRGGQDGERYVAGSLHTIRGSRVVPPAELGLGGGGCGGGVTE